MNRFADHAQRCANAIPRLRVKALHEHVDTIQIQILPILTCGNQLAIFDAAWMMRIELDADKAIATLHDSRLRE